MQHLTLSNGVKIPVLGCGVYRIADPDECRRVVLDALETGYRLIDTAQAYHNEKAVGLAVKDSGLPREEVFITSKIWVSDSGESKAEAAIDASLRKMGLDFIDLMLIHQPFGDYYGTYRALEKALRDGRVRAIGVSNFFADRLVDLCLNFETRPHINQMETHIFQQQKALRPYLDRYRVQLESWGPFAAGCNSFFEHPVLSGMADRYSRTAAQIALRFLVQSGIVVIPKTVSRKRMEENINIFDFELSRGDMELLRSLDSGKSVFCDHYDPEFVSYMATLRP